MCLHARVDNVNIIEASDKTEMDKLIVSLKVEA